MQAWWEEAVIYQIYPRSFADSNGDGIGDLPGITGRLPYIKELGADAIWLSPVYASPMADFGYDISDYRAIAPMFGTLDDAFRLISEAHRLGLRVIFDMVLNHTSDRHPWFLESKRSRDSEKKDFYIWSDKIPSNWLSAFGGKGWTFAPERGQYYFHSFLPEQPDLNWRNEETVKAIFDEVGFWLENGVDGFRLDVINCIVKDSSFRDNPHVVGSRPRPYDMQRHIFDRNRPEAHEKLRRLRSFVDSFGDRMLVGEIMVEEPGEPEMAASFLGAHHDELNLAFDFSLLSQPFDAMHWQRAAKRWYEAVGTHRCPTWVLNNHDALRAVDRFGKDEAKVRLAALFLLTQRGTVFLYYGEEVGLEGSVVPRRAIQDPVGKRYWPFNKGRDPARGPMVWDEREGHGFSDASPWLPFARKADRFSVERQRNDPSSVLSLYKQLIALRAGDAVLRQGTCTFLETGNRHVMAYERVLDGDRRVVYLNFSKRRQNVLADVISDARLQVSTHEGESPVRQDGTIVLEPYRGVLLDVGKSGTLQEDTCPVS
jgi:alpha-glucosidase